MRQRARPAEHREKGREPTGAGRRRRPILTQSPAGASTATGAALERGNFPKSTSNLV